jgi:class 3 adenylate cyclase
MSVERPTGTITFLFTDIEGSTRLWEQHPDQMKTALARHDAILRTAIESGGGNVFKTVGDAFYAAFTNAPDALLSAVEAQKALASAAWDEPLVIRVRMGLHTAAWRNAMRITSARR